MLVYNRLELKPLQRRLRRNLTDAERAVWNIVRNRQVAGLKFFRQYAVEHYILDFYCPQIQMAIEIDGGQHNESPNLKRDEARSENLKSLNIKVLRFWNHDVLQNPEGIYDAIIKTTNELLPTSSL